ncbi:MAG: amidohydrolase family protein [Xanthomonas sp.]
MSLRVSQLARAVGAALLLAASAASAQDVLIRNATVHTVSARGTLEATDVLLHAGRITQIGASLSAPAGASSVDAKGRALTPGLWAGLNGIGIEEVSQEPTTVDATLAPGAQTPPQAMAMRPEFDPTLAFNPRSSLLPVARIEGLTWTVLTPNAVPGGSLVAGQGAAASLDGSYDAIWPATRTLFVTLGSSGTALAGGSRAAEYMLLDQAVREARGGASLRDRDYQLLSPAGRETLARYLGGGRVAFAVDRAADIRQARAFAARIGVKPVIVGGTEAWIVADAIKRADAAVIIDALGNLPGSFDQLAAGLDTAAKLQAAGVRFAFNGEGSHNARKIRQSAGNAVAHGLAWDAGLAAITATPAAIFGVGGERGRVEVGLVADLVLWSGDPLEVTTVAEQVWIAGRAVTMRSRQTELRDRYLPQQPTLPRAYIKP